MGVSKTLRGGARILCALMLFFAAENLTAVLAAQSSASGTFKPLTVDELMNIEVTTVTRHASTVGESAAAVHVITSEDIRRSGATVIPELFRMVPGMSVARIDNNKWVVGVRGFNDRFYGKLLVQIDGRTLYNPTNAGVNWDAVDYPLEDIDRIEVIRGPGASVWGANAVNGIVNIITKPAEKTQGGRITAGTGSQEDGFGSLRHGGEAGRGTFYRGYLKGFHRREQYSLSGDPRDHWKGASAGFRIDKYAGSGDTWTIQGDILRSDAGSKDFRPQSTPPYSFTNIETERTQNTNLLTRWTRESDNDSSWTLQFYWDGFRRRLENLEIDLNWNAYDIDAQYQRTVGLHLKIVYGTALRMVDSSLSDSGSDAGFLLTWNRNRRRDVTVSGFVQHEVAVAANRVTLTVGTKVEHNDTTGWEAQPTSRLLWKVHKSHALWAAVSRAVRTPSLTEEGAFSRFVPYSTPPIFPRASANPNLDAEKARTFELGYRGQPISRLSLDVAAFHSRYDDLIGSLAGPRESGPNGTITLPLQRVNGLDAGTYGMDVATTLSLTQNWRFYGTYGYLRMNLQRGGGLSASAEAAEGQSPRHQVYAKSSWNLPRNVELDLMGRFVGRLDGFNPASAPDVTNTIKSYTSLDLRLAWMPTTRLSLEFLGQNLLDRHHAEFGTSPAVRSPLVEIQRSAVARINCRF
jgi:iron complex outermembrane recepter protein